jgi:hypothetical protein
MMWLHGLLVAKPFSNLRDLGRLHDPLSLVLAHASTGHYIDSIYMSNIGKYLEMRILCYLFGHGAKLGAKRKPGLMINDKA